MTKRAHYGMDHGCAPKHVEASKNETATSRSTLKRFLAYRSYNIAVGPDISAQEAVECSSRR